MTKTMRERTADQHVANIQIQTHTNEQHVQPVFRRVHVYMLLRLACEFLVVRSVAYRVYFRMWWQRCLDIVQDDGL
jgi:hypothetical protein